MLQEWGGTGGGVGVTVLCVDYSEFVHTNVELAN